VTVRLVGLGGLGEFGANSMLIEDGEARVLLDAGAAFSNLESFGVGYEVPDFGGFGEHAPAHVLFTHGHDDHLKGLASLLEACPDIGVWGTRPTLARARQSGVAFVGRQYGGDARFGVDRWSVDALPASHSIPGTVLLRIGTPVGRLVFATDFRLAVSALGERTSLDALHGWGSDGVDILMLDSTNALVERDPPTEAAVGEALAELVNQAPGAVVAVTFASHVGRFRQLAMAAAASGRVVVPVGRGLVETLDVQTFIDGLDLPLGLVRRARELAELPHGRVVLVATGSQAEAGSAFARLAVDQLAGFRLSAGDTVIHAARVIPGSERRLAHLFDHCVRRGARVITAAEAPVHTSGHAHRKELSTVLEALRPSWVIPVHGRRRHLGALADLAMAHGCRTLIVENGEEMAWGGREVELTGERRGLGRVLLDDVGEAVLDSAVLRDRRIMAQEGVVVAVLPCRRGGPAVGAAPRVHSIGLDIDEALRCSLERELGDALGRGGPLARGDPDWLRSTMTQWLRSELRRRIRRRPAVVALVLEV
jgi:ribonuclease J